MPDAAPRTCAPFLVAVGLLSYFGVKDGDALVGRRLSARLPGNSQQRPGLEARIGCPDRTRAETGSDDAEASLAPPAGERRHGSKPTAALRTWLLREASRPGQRLEVSVSGLQAGISHWEETGRWGQLLRSTPPPPPPPHEAEGPPPGSQKPHKQVQLLHISRDPWLARATLAPLCSGSFGGGLSAPPQPSSVSSSSSSSSVPPEQLREQVTHSAITRVPT